MKSTRRNFIDMDADTPMHEQGRRYTELGKDGEYGDAPVCSRVSLPHWRNKCLKSTVVQHLFRSFRIPKAMFLT